MTGMLYQRYRPKSIKELRGNAEAVSMLKDMHKRDAFPHAMIFSGESGTGKTTVGRILRTRLKCSEQDFCEINAAEVRGVDSIRSIAARMGLSPLGGEARIYFFDEAHQLTKDAQSALLKMLEDTPPHVYFFLSTNEPQKLLPTIRTRCTVIPMKPLAIVEMRELLYYVAEQEGREPTEDVIDTIVKIAEGSSRKALVLLESVVYLDDEKEQMALLIKADTQSAAIDLARQMADGSPWSKVAMTLRGLETEDPEKLRRLILSYCNRIALNNGKDVKRQLHIIECMREPLYDVGWPGLTLACYRATEGK